LAAGLDHGKDRTACDHTELAPFHGGPESDLGGAVDGRLVNAEFVRLAVT